jgi:hypothetical protein
MFFHSTTLKAGLNQFVRKENDEKRFIRRIQDFLVFARESGIESIKLSDTMKLFSLFISYVIFQMLSVYCMSL